MLLEVSNLYCRVLHATKDEEKWLDRILSFPDKSYQARVNGDGRIHLLNTVTQSFPSGLVRAVQRRAAKDSKDVKLVDRCVRRVKPDPRPLVDWLRDHQADALESAKKYNRGVFHHVTGAGKTEVMVALAELFPGKWLILTHNKSLMEEIRQRFLKRTGEEIGMYGDGFRDLSKRVTVAMFQSLHKNLSDPKVKKWLASIDGLSVDECHVIPAGSFWRVSMALPNAFYRYGFSGTPFSRSDSKSLYVIAALGPAIHRVPAEDLIRKGLLAQPNIRLVPVQHQPGKRQPGGGRPSWDAVYKEAIVRNQTRNAVLAHVAAKLAKKPAFLFVKALEHGRALEKDLRARGVKVEFVWGAHETPQRRAALRRLVHGDVDVLICNVIFQVGIDVPELQSVIIGSGGKSAIMVLQDVGRGTRRHAHDGSVTKDTFDVFDIQDKGCGCRGRHAVCRWMDKHTKDRLSAYATEKYPVFITKVEGAAIRRSHEHQEHDRRRVAAHQR